MTNPHYRFGAFRLDPAARELWKDGERVALPASALDGLAYLVRHRDRAVGRDELIAAIWGKSEVADALLAQTILRIRRTLGDTGSEQGAIRTVPRFGYRWVAETIEETFSAPAAAASVVAAPSREPARGPRPRSRWIAFAAAAIVAAASALALRAWRGATQPETAPSLAASAVVLPAETPEQAEWSWLRLGLMDLVASRLRQGGIAAAESESVLALLKQSGSAEPDFAGALKIRPRAAFHGGRWKIALAADGKDLHASAEGEGEDVLAAGRAAADQLLIRLGRAPPASGAAAPIALEELMQRTRAAILADQFELAADLIARAPPELREKPEIALRLAQIEIGQGRYDAARTGLALLLDRATKDMEPALRGRILNALGGVEFRTDRLAEAEATYAEAIERLQPIGDAAGLGLAHSGRAAIAARQGDLDAAAEELGRARVELEAAGDALSLAQIDMNLGLVAGQRYRPAEAAPILREAAARFATLGAREELAYARYALVGIELQRLDLGAARAASDAAWPPEAHTGNERLRWQLVLARAFLLVAEGELAQASQLLERIGRESSPELDAATRASAEALRARIAWLRGDAAQAAALADAALVPKLESEEPDLYLDTWLTSLRAHRVGLGPPSTSLAALRAWIDAHPNERREAFGALAEAEQALAEGRRDDALAKLADAWRRVDRLGVAEDRVEVASAYASALIAAGRLDQARAIVGGIAAFADRDLRAASAEAELYRALERSDAWHEAAERSRRLARERVMPMAARAAEGGPSATPRRSSE